VVLVIRSNGLDQPQEVVAKPLTGPNYQLLQRGPWCGNDCGDVVDMAPKLSQAEEARRLAAAENIPFATAKKRLQRAPK
jgi:hypothetical protein